MRNVGDAGASTNPNAGQLGTMERNERNRGGKSTTGKIEGNRRGVVGRQQSTREVSERWKPMRSWLEWRKEGVDFWCWRLLHGMKVVDVTGEID